MLTGGAWQGLLGTVEGARPLPETAVVLAGARDFDEPEERRLDSSAVAHLTPDSSKSPEPLLEAIAALVPAPTGLYVHVDLDVLDIDEARVNIYSAPDGLSAQELESVVGAIAHRCPVRAFSLTAYDPEYDADDRVPPIALRLLGIVAGYVSANANEPRPKS